MKSYLSLLTATAILLNFAMAIPSSRAGDKNVDFDKHKEMALQYNKNEKECLDKTTGNADLIKCHEDQIKSLKQHKSEIKK